MPRSWLKVAEDKLAEDGNTVAPIEGDGADVENPGNSGIGTKADKVDSDTPEYTDPNGEEWCVCKRGDSGPNMREWKKAVSGEREDCAAKGLHGGKADELDDDEARDCEEDSSTSAERVVV